MYKYTSRGFTLIELMIVVAIIAILAAIAIPQYMSYVATSRVTAGLHTITAAETQWTHNAMHGIQSTTATRVGLPDHTDSCSTFAVTDTSGANGPTGSIQCTLQGIASIQDKTITVTLTSQVVDTSGAITTAGGWACTTNVTRRFRPTGCTKK